MGGCEVTMAQAERAAGLVWGGSVAVMAFMRWMQSHRKSGCASGSSSDTGGAPLVLCVGLACVDFVNTVDAYPAEDTLARASDQTVRRGGNASNTASVLATQRVPTGWCGSVGVGPMADLILNELRAFSVTLWHPEPQSDQAQPTSHIVSSSGSNTRTVVLHNTLRELDDRELQQVCVDGLQWLHIEGRPNSSALKALMIRAAAQGVIVSLELEKPRPEDIQLAVHADLVMLSAAFCESCGFAEPLACIDAATADGKIRKSAIAVCTAGEHGAVATRGGKRWSSAAFPPAAVIDTVGAGDTFNAGMIHALHTATQQGVDIATHADIPGQAIRYACQLAGAKVGMNGYAQLSTHPPFQPQL